MLIDMRGKPCPIPVIEAKKKLKELNVGDCLTVIVDNDIARQNLEKMAKGLGHAFSFQVEENGCIKAVLELLPVCEIESGEAGSLVVAISNDSMGGPSEELGQALMKSFVYSLTELPKVPDRLIFFNGGVRLACEGASTLEDLAALEQKGCQISSCGACLNFYKLTEKLKIGEVTNMYAIVSAMSEATRLVNL